MNNFHIYVIIFFLIFPQGIGAADIYESDNFLRGASAIEVGNQSSDNIFDDTVYGYPQRHDFTDKDDE